jgi:hypothetical protein
MPTLTLHGINGDSARNYHLIWTRNPPEEWLFRRESPVHEPGIHLKNVYSTGNYQIMDEESIG